MNFGKNCKKDAGFLLAERVVLYSQTKWSIALKITLMNWLFESLNPLVVSRMQQWIDYLNVELASYCQNQYSIDFCEPISRILGTTSGFSLPIINSLLHS